MQLKRDNEWFTFTTNEIKYTRNINSKLYSIVQVLDAGLTYQAMLLRISAMSGLDNETMILFSTLNT